MNRKTFIIIFIIVFVLVLLAAVIGYLYLKGDNEKIMNLMEKIEME